MYKLNFIDHKLQVVELMSYDFSMLITIGRAIRWFWQIENKDGIVIVASYNFHDTTGINT